jgi:hypothetical protein
MKEVGYVDVGERITKIPINHGWLRDCWLRKWSPEQSQFGRIGNALFPAPNAPFPAPRMANTTYLFVGLSSSHSPFYFAPPSTSPKGKFLTIDVGLQAPVYFQCVSLFPVGWTGQVSVRNSMRNRRLCTRSRVSLDGGLGCIFVS